jgi:hypothetical protein
MIPRADSLLWRANKLSKISPSAHLKFWASIKQISSLHLSQNRDLHNPAYSTHIPPLWSTGQRSWLEIQRSGFDSWCYQIFWEVVGLDRGPLSLVSITEELLGRNSSGSCLENREYGRTDPLHWPCDTPYPPKSPLTSPSSGGSLVAD